ARYLLIELFHALLRLHQQRLRVALARLDVDLERLNRLRAGLDDLVYRVTKGFERRLYYLSLYLFRSLGGQRGQESARAVDALALFVGDAGRAQHRGEVDRAVGGGLGQVAGQLDLGRRRRRGLARVLLDQVVGRVGRLLALALAHDEPAE